MKENDFSLSLAFILDQTKVSRKKKEWKFTSQRNATFICAVKKT